MQRSVDGTLGSSCKSPREEWAHGSGAGKDGVTVGDQEPEIECGDSMGEKEAMLSGV